MQEPDTASGYGVCACGGDCSKSNDPALSALLAGIRKAWPGMSARERALLAAVVGIEGGKV
ncbi:MAG TPA: hypothetical protein P5137_08030 [Candidatus Brocadiia bacterium]|nr:hypothetical protein [Candidatus Brocadiia bacterium]